MKTTKIKLQKHPTMRKLRKLTLPQLFAKTKTSKYVPTNGNENI